MAGDIPCLWPNFNTMGTWTEWNFSGNTATSTWTSNSSSTRIWCEWVNTTATCSNGISTYAPIVWRNWTMDGSDVEYQTSTYTPHAQPVRVATPEEMAEQVRQAEVRAARETMLRQSEQKRREAAEAAAKRAEELLLEFLNDEQRKEYKANKMFHVVGQDGERYRVGYGWAGHVRKLNKAGREVEVYCIHPDKQIPVPDNQLIAKLMLEGDLDRFRRIANRNLIAAG